MLYRYQKPLQEIYDEYLEKHNQTGVKPYPDKLLALLLLQDKENYEPENLVNGEFYRKYKQQIDEKINQVITDFHLTKEDIISFIEEKGIYPSENRYEHNKIWFVFASGFVSVIWTQRWHPSYSKEKAYDVYQCCFHNSPSKEQTNTRERTKKKVRERTRINNLRSRNGYKHN